MRIPETPAAVLLVDDHALVRDGVREILNAHPDIKVVGEASDSEGAVELAESLQPHVVLLDVDIPGRSAPETVRRIRQAAPGVAVIILSMFDGPSLLRSLLAAGINGYLLKSSTKEQLAEAIRAVRSDPNRVVLSVSHDSLSRLPATSSPLTEREREVLQLTAEALSNGQIATRLSLTEATVKRHLRSIFSKLGAVSRIDAVNKGFAAALITAPGDSASLDSR